MAKAKRVLERSLQKTVLDRLRELARHEPALAFRKRHGSAMGTAGDPDIYGLYRGIHFELELKRPGESPTRLQGLRLEEWGRAGATTAVIRSTEDLEHFLAGLELDSL